jgi:hypothetical protein
MSYLARGPGGTPGIDSKAHASKEPTPVGCADQYRSVGEGMSYLARGPGGTPGIDSKAHASKEPTPSSAQIVDATGGDSMSYPVVTATASSPSTSTPQAAP